jgi:hypothetical protein
VSRDLFGFEPPQKPERKRKWPPAAKQARDDALERVSRNAGYDWMGDSLRLLRIFADLRDDFIGEEFRLYATQHGLPQPHHHNAWGALLRTGATRGIIRITDRTRQMTTGKSHARRSPVWESVR